MPSRKRVPNPHDAFFRRVFSRVQTAAEFLRLYLPAEIVESLDLSQLSLEDASFVDDKLREHFSDLFFRAGLRDGGQAFVYFLLEHKSTPDERVMLQLLRYLAQAWDRLPLPLPMIVPVVIYHGAASWRVGRKLGDLFDMVAQKQIWRRYLPDFEYHLCDLSRYRDEELKGEAGVAEALKLLKHIFRRDVKTKMPEILENTAWQQPMRERTWLLRAMIQYLLETGRVTEPEISMVLFGVSQKGDRVRTTEQTVDDIMNGVGAARLTLHQLHYKFGEIDDNARKQIIGLPLKNLLQLGEALLDFQSLDDLDQWLKRHPTHLPPKSKRQTNGSRNDVKKKLGSN